jgi:tetratricopeptide (TPR) repeat protein
MSLGTESALQSARAALDAARGVFAPGQPTPAPALWQAAQQVLQLVLGRPELTGHALVGEARRLGVLTLSDAHALVGLSSWADRSEAPAADEAERLLVRESWMALEHAVPDVPPQVAPPRPPPPRRPAQDTTFAPPRAQAQADALPNDTAVAPRHRRGPLLAALVALVVAGSAGGLWWYTGRADRLYRDGVEAFQRGAREVARTTFVQMAQQHPDDARPLVYLGRLSREDGDLARSRRFLTSAVRLAPGSAIAARELAGVMLADGQPEIARRFYVRAIELDPTDRMAQGFLGCALARLQRVDEARRWIDRAGPGDWQRCLPPTPLLPPGALPPAVPPALPPS